MIYLFLCMCVDMCMTHMCSWKSQEGFLESIFSLNHMDSGVTGHQHKGQLSLPMKSSHLPYFWNVCSLSFVSFFFSSFHYCGFIEKLEIRYCVTSRLLSSAYYCFGMSGTLRFHFNFRFALQSLQITH